MGAIGAFLIAPVSVSWAQDAADTAGVVVDLTLSETITASDNLDLETPAASGMRSTTGLVGSISSVTRTQSFVLGFEVGADLDSDGFELGDTGVDATYIRMGPGSEFELNARYFSVGLTSEFDDGLSGTIISSGTRVDYGYGARLLLGADGPLGFEVSARQDEREFTSTDPDAIDTTTKRANASVTAQIDPATTARLGFGFTEVQENEVGGDLTATTTVGAGITRGLDAATEVSFDVDWNRIAATGLGPTDVTEGLSGQLSYERTLPAGSVSASLGRTITQDNTIDELRLSRAFEDQTSSFLLEGGAILTDGSTLSPFIGLGYSRETRDTVLSLGLDQAAGVDGDDEVTLSTTLDASITRDINAVSSVSASVGYRYDYVIDGGDFDSRLDGALTYNRSLSDTARLSAGYQYTAVTETGAADVSSNTVFLTISKSFSARP